MKTLLDLCLHVPQLAFVAGPLDASKNEHDESAALQLPRECGALPVPRGPEMMLDQATSLEIDAAPLEPLHELGIAALMVSYRLGEFVVHHS